MASRFFAARPKRASEAFARAHHGDDRDSDDAAGSAQGLKKVKFDIRNPSALAPSAQDVEDGEDDVLAADVIGGTRAMKRGAVNIDGYDSDSDTENFTERAEMRVKKGKEAEDIDLVKVMDNYNPATHGPEAVDEDEDDEIDMFGDADEDDADSKPAQKGKKGKEVHFLEEDQIEGQEGASKSGGRVSLFDDPASSDDENDSDIEAAIAEEGIDEEVGAGGLKRHAPKIDAFNMKQEQQEGRFDESGNYIRKATDGNEKHDTWMVNISKKQMKQAAAAQEKREAEIRKKQLENDSIITSDLLKDLILQLEKGEKPLEALARLNKDLAKQPKKIPQWKLKKQQRNATGGADAMDVDAQKQPEDPKQVEIKKAVEAITDATDKLSDRDYQDILEMERERLIREYSKETGEDWEEPRVAVEENGATMWEFRWVDGRENANTQGPFDGLTMKAWQDAGYFVGGVEFRPVGVDKWSLTATFV